MITVSQALEVIDKHCIAGKSETKHVFKTLGLVLAEDVYSPMNMPPFRQSAMDGYAIIYSNQKVLKVIDEIQAGAAKKVLLTEGEAARIFTGAKMPENADTVVIQEDVIRQNDEIIIQNIPKPSANVRPIGEQIKSGEIALQKGTILNEASIGFLAGLGIEKVNVYKTPKVRILVTGNELQQLGKKLVEGQIYESNSVTLKIALKRFGIKKIKISRVEDTLSSTTKAISACLKKADIVLISGGISVGDYDFVKEALHQNGVEEIFYKVNQKPGKPLWFGKKKSKFVFALPGNPASSLTCFYIYVLPLLKAQMGFEKFHLPRATACASSDINNSTGKTLFLKGNVSDSKAEALTGQASSMLRSFAESNALLMVPKGKEIIKKGEEITYLKLQ